MEDEANFLSTNVSEVGFGEISGTFGIEIVATGSGEIEKADNVKKSSFAATRGSHDHNKFTWLNFKIEVVEGKRLSFAIAKTTSNIF